MSLNWWEWGNVQEKLRRFALAIQGPRPYRVRLLADPKLCPTGWCNYSTREIAANPAAFLGAPDEQYQLTKALLVHEAGHRRFTSPVKLTGVVKEVENILEDERVERLIAAHFAGLGSLLRRLSERAYVDADPVEPGDDPVQVVAYFLQLRWARRIGRSVKGVLSARNRALWEEVAPLVEEAWVAPTTERVAELAREIVRRLGLTELPVGLAPEPDVIGERGRVDLAEPGGVEEAQAPDASAASPSPGLPPAPFDGEALTPDHPAGSGPLAVEPRPYLELEARARPLAEALVEELRFEPGGEGEDYAARGGRLVVRQLLHDPGAPFLVATEESGHRPPTIALRVLVDHSTSMNVRSGSDGRTRMEAVAEAVMVLHLACLALGIEHQVVVVPQGVGIADLGSGERGKALIAGLVPAQTSWEDVGKHLARELPELASTEAEIKLAAVLHDGFPNDAELARDEARRHRGRVETVGVLLDPDEESLEAMRAIFGPDRLIGTAADELPARLGSLLRSLRGL